MNENRIEQTTIKESEYWNDLEQREAALRKEKWKKRILISFIIVVIVLLLITSIYYRTKTTYGI